MDGNEFWNQDFFHDTKFGRACALALTLVWGLGIWIVIVGGVAAMLIGSAVFLAACARAAVFIVQFLGM